MIYNWRYPQMVLCALIDIPTTKTRSKSTTTSPLGMGSALLNLIGIRILSEWHGVRWLLSICTLPHWPDALRYGDDWFNSMPNYIVSVCGSCVNLGGSCVNARGSCFNACGSCVNARGSCVYVCGSCVHVRGSCVNAHGSCVNANSICILRCSCCALHVHIWIVKWKQRTFQKT